MLELPGVRVDDARLAEVLDPSARLVRLYEHAIWSEGPVWWQHERTLVFSDVRGRQVLGRRENGAVDVLLDATPYCNGNAVTADGDLVHCEHGRRGISRTRRDSNELLVERSADGRLNSPNDIVVARDGAIWFTDPVFGLTQPEEGFMGRQEVDHEGVYRFVEGAATLMATLDGPNGLGFSPDERVLYVSRTPPDAAADIVAFDWDGRRLSGRRHFAHVEQGIPDGFAVDDRGWLWSSSRTGIQVFDDRGATLGLVPAPHIVSNCTFDSDHSRLFVTGDADLLMLTLGPASQR
ncbi:SMP-30/gluconolactonase/LRE family protein [Phycicoccus flavus]|uniref:SMP-30/gluconolactonase/LRE family protein n=1 Tax=Phycicoccus flavus TaxID=2502783 RepID=UPI000FEC155C|nr:SMP-30/gluconolactonase/LRE family protein [Phycicoccus flavus]NHA68601.1 SMP-30/gluconolactonase/LRE family protein [Phycicoccus flavus]NHA68700.1 SMP-30/gluconolactonase/LRE family protein [Phycicoccus flavus]